MIEPFELTASTDQVVAPVGGTKPLWPPGWVHTQHPLPVGKSPISVEPLRLMAVVGAMALGEPIATDPPATVQTNGWDVFGPTGWSMKRVPAMVPPSSLIACAP